MKDYLKLKTLGTKKLYTIFCQYKRTGVLSIHWQDMQKIMGTNYKTLSRFKQKVYDPYISEIIEVTNVKTVIPHPKKVGRKILDWYFTFAWNKQLKLIDEPPKLDPEFIRTWQRLQKDFGLGTKQADRIIEQVSLEDINHELYQIKLLKIGNQIKSNIGGFTYSLDDMEHGVLRNNKG